MSPRRFPSSIALTLSLGLLGAPAAYGQALAVGTPLPRLEADTLADTKVVLPDAAAGKPAVVVFSFSRGAGDKAEAWSTALRKRFGASGPTVWSAASLQGAPRFIRGMIRGGMRKQTPKDAHERALCLYTDDKLWRQRLGITNDELPVVVALDATGTIVWLDHAAHDATREQAIVEKTGFGLQALGRVRPGAEIRPDARSLKPGAFLRY